MRALVVTVVHHPDDSRIRFREITALLDAGWDVTYAAPFTGYGVAPRPVADIDDRWGFDGVASSPARARSSLAFTPDHTPDATPPNPRLTQVDVPRAAGRRRLRALRGARRVLKEHGPAHDVVLLHDPELLAALPGMKGLPAVVWDVHEDTAAAVTLKAWLPRPLRPVVRWAFARVERLAERKVNLLLAEYAYAERFRNEHLVVPNVTRVPPEVPPPDEPRVIYVGSMTTARGAADMVEVGRLVHAKTGGGVRVRLIGPAAADIEPLLRAAADDGVLDWPGMVPNDQAMAQVDGSLAGISLLHDEPNYRVSLPTKVTDYIAHGVPVVTTPLPLARDLVEKADCGIIVPFSDRTAAADAVLALWEDPARRRAMGAAGHRLAMECYDWTTHAASFVSELTRIAQA